MSFILDALKKSETERQQQSNAEFSGVPTSSGTAAVPRWVWAAGILLAINLAVLTGLLLKSDAVSTQPVTPSAAEITHFPEEEESRSTRSFETRVAAAQLSPPQQQIQEAVGQLQETPSKTIGPVLISQNPAAIPAAEIYPSIQEVRASGLSDVPELHLDIHVYSLEPKNRFVFINMKKLREGSQLDEGPVVAEITPDGVVLRHQGQQFLLARD